MRVSETLINEEHDIMERVSGLPIDALALAVMSNIWRASQAFRNDMEQQILRDYNLTFSSFSTLFIVWIWGPIEMSAIAASQSVARSTISSTVNGLEKKGWVKRMHMGKNGDGRSIQVEITKSGRTLIEEVFPKFNAGEKSFVEGLTTDEAETLAFLLRKLLINKKIR
ncbi:MAG: MarR family winged helix-turn-helix transcriptional regulator [Anaerolineae bacterium]